MEMNEQTARAVLADMQIVPTEKGIAAYYHQSIDWLEWEVTDSMINLEGHFTAAQLKALAWWMENKRKNVTQTP